MNVAAITFGGGVRVGLEDNIWFDEERTQLATNRKLVERVLLIAEALESRPYSVRELKEIFNHS
jgi:uncharacterized protein (DUF849 family)